MDGKLLKERLRELLNEDSGSRFLDTRTTFDFCYEAALATANVLENLKASTTLTTVVDQTSYTLPALFSKLYLKDSNKRFFVKYNDGSNDSFIFHTSYEDIVYSNNSTSVSIPERFTIMDYPSLSSAITGTATSASDDVGGKSSLIDSGGGLSSASIGDIIHNTTDASTGYVIAVTSDTQLEVCLFGGTDNEWDISDAYIIVPQGRMQLILDPPPSTAGHTITVYYLEKPIPVYSDYDTYRFPPEYFSSIIKYAAWLYKYRDQEPQFGDAFYIYWDKELRANKNTVDKSINRSGYKIVRKHRR